MYVSDILSLSCKIHIRNRAKNTLFYNKLILVNYVYAYISTLISLFAQDIHHQNSPLYKTKILAATINDPFVNKDIIAFEATRLYGISELPAAPTHILYSVLVLGSSTDLR